WKVACSWTNGTTSRRARSAPSTRSSSITLSSWGATARAKAGAAAVGPRAIAEAAAATLDRPPMTTAPMPRITARLLPTAAVAATRAFRFEQSQAHPGRRVGFINRDHDHGEDRDQEGGYQSWRHRNQGPAQEEDPQTQPDQ